MSSIGVVSPWAPPNLRQVLGLDSDYRAALLATSGVIRYWRGGEVSGTVSRDEFATNHGTYVGAPTLGVASPVVSDRTTGFTLNGTTQYMRLVSGVGVLAQWAIGMWINPTASGAEPSQRLWSMSGNRMEIRRDVADGTIKFYANGVGWTNSAQSVAAGAWSKVTVAFDGTNLSLIVNGVLVYGPTGGGVGISLTAVECRVGSAVDGGAGFLPGSIKDVFVMNRAITVAEDLALYKIATATS